MSEKIRVIREMADEILRCMSDIILNDADIIQSTSNRQKQAIILSENNTTTVTIPLLAHDSLLGEMQFRRNYTFNEDEILLAKGLAAEASIIIENEHMYENAKRQSMALSTVADISNAIASILDSDLLLNSVASLIQKYFNYPHIYVFTVHRWQKKIQLRAEGSGKLHFDADQNFYESSVDSDFLTNIVEHKRTLLSNEIPPNHSLSQLPPIEALSELLVPLVFGDQVLGILYIRSELEGAFKQSDVLLLETLSDNIAIALRNANLYRSEQWRRRVAESMRDIAGLLSADVDLNHLLNQLLEELTKTLPCETAAIWLIENSETETGIEQFTSSLRLEALNSPNNELQDLFLLADSSSWSQWLKDIFETHYPVIRDVDMGFEPFDKLLGYPNDYSAIISPLLIGSQPLGILLLAHPQHARYGSEAQSIVATFASYAAVAIKNTQLYETAHDQAWVSTVLLQVAEATQSINNLDELIRTVVEIIPQLVGVEACAVLLWDRTLEEFTPFAASGLTPEQQIYFDQWHIEKNEIAGFDQILNSRKPVIFNQSLDPLKIDTDLYNILNLEHKLFVLFPMVSQTDIQGTILVDFSEKNSERDNDLWEEKFLIIQGIAHQTAVAVENIKLIQSQEEEAYVSIALLQVAQAIVNASEIDDVLNVVARITPILVAMRRCAIYLWDFQRNIFHYSQSYGIARSEIAEAPLIYKPSAFPLLESVRSSNHIVCHLIGNDSFSFSDWMDLEDDDCVLIDSIDQETDNTINSNIKDIFSNRLGLLLAYPIAIKGTVFGVMVTEEELTERGIPSIHIRERRVEIVTGITQQVAVAIQNDILQREALQRERFDRELQLAQEIQANFMPDKLPILEGWELDVKWKPARQVGGDYYDVFELSEGRIGLVIADVADKGMPAALFMTLVRTLLRATVRDNKSPAEALLEVNELLVPDAKNGMFVTLVYGILYPDSGDVVYANAGHVPPLLIDRDTKNLVELFPSSMALGVLQNIAIEERHLQLDYGDCLLLYTDGVSEAFSPTNEMYGSDRLKQMIIQSEISSANNTLEMIVSAVSDFTASAAMSDDLTIMALYRKLKL